MDYDSLKISTASMPSMNQTISQLQSALSIQAAIPSSGIKTMLGEMSKTLALSSQLRSKSVKSLTSAMSLASNNFASQLPKGVTAGALAASHLTIKKLSSGIPPMSKASCFPSLSQLRAVQGLVQTINSFNPNDVVLPSGTINDINSADIHIDTVDVSENLANNITAVLKENDIFIEGSMTSSQKSKTISISTFKKYLEMIVTLITIASFIYTIGHDYISDKTNAKYQSQMLKEAHQQTLEDKKQTKLLQDIDDKLSIISTSTSTEKR